MAYSIPFTAPLVPKAVFSTQATHKKTVRVKNQVGNLMITEADVTNTLRRDVTLKFPTLPRRMRRELERHLKTHASQSGH